MYNTINRQQKPPADLATEALVATPLQCHKNNARQNLVALAGIIVIFIYFCTLVILSVPAPPVFAYVLILFTSIIVYLLTL